MMQAVILFGSAHNRLFALAQQDRMICNGKAGHVRVAKAALIVESQDVLIEVLRLFEIIHRDGPVRHIVKFQHAHKNSFQSAAAAVASRCAMKLFMRSIMRAASGAGQPARPCGISGNNTSSTSPPAAPYSSATFSTMPCGTPLSA